MKRLQVHIWYRNRAFKYIQLFILYIIITSFLPNYVYPCGKYIAFLNYRSWFLSPSSSATTHGESVHNIGQRNIWNEIPSNLKRFMQFLSYSAILCCHQNVIQIYILLKFTIKTAFFIVTFSMQILWKWNKFNASIYSYRTTSS